MFAGKIIVITLSTIRPICALYKQKDTLMRHSPVKKITREKAIRRLKTVLDRQAKYGTTDEEDHMEADKVLIQLLGDQEIAELFWEIDRWYA
jgi:hypothetical protein